MCVCLCVLYVCAYYLDFFLPVFRTFSSYSLFRIKCEFCELWIRDRLIPFSFHSRSIPFHKCAATPVSTHCHVACAHQFALTMARMFGKCLHKIYVDYTFYTATRRHIPTTVPRIWMGPENKGRRERERPGRS